MDVIDEPEPDSYMPRLGARMASAPLGVANAILQATGKRVCDLPITSAKLI
jgi:CO/xanthine dehydrogenase Mo-binding subunit